MRNCRHHGRQPVAEEDLPRSLLAHPRTAGQSLSSGVMAVRAKARVGRSTRSRARLTCRVSRLLAFSSFPPSWPRASCVECPLPWRQASSIRGRSPLLLAACLWCRQVHRARLRARASAQRPRPAAHPPRPSAHRLARASRTTVASRSPMSLERLCYRRVRCRPCCCRCRGRRRAVRRRPFLQL